MSAIKSVADLLVPLVIVVVSTVLMVSGAVAIPGTSGTPTGSDTSCTTSAPGSDDGQGPMAGIHPTASSILRSLGITGGMISQGLGRGNLSSGTHGPIPGSSYGAAADISVSGMSNDRIKQLVHDLRMRGFVTWYREPGWDVAPGNAHIHAAYAGLPSTNEVASVQVQTFLNSESRRRNGLADDDRPSGRDPYSFPLDTFPTPEEMASVRSVRAGGSGCVGSQTGSSSLDNYALPATAGRSCTEQHLQLSAGEGAASHYQRSNTPLAARNGMASGNGSFGYASVEQERYYITMRWNYADWYSDPSERDSYGRPKTTVRNVNDQAMSWHRHKKVLVTNPSNGRQVVASVEESGPAIWTNKVSGLSPEALQALGIKVRSCGMTLNYAWADQNTPLGPVR